MTRGTGRGAAISRPSAGKTGTTSEYRDAWFVGFTPNLAAAVWIGDDNNDSLGGMTGGGEPATLWRTFMTYAVDELPVEDFERPSGFKEPVRVNEPNDDKKAEEDKKKKEAEEKKKKTADEKKEAQDAKPSESGSKASSSESSAPRSSIAPPPVRPPKQ